VQSTSCDRVSSVVRRCLTAAAAVSGLALAPAWGGEPSVPYVPTPQDVVERMLQIAKVTPRDYVIDLGSGDGRIVITAAKKFGARGFGVDIDPRLVERSKKLAAQAGVAKRAAFYARDLYQTDVSRATVLTMYLLPEVVLMVRPKLLAELKPGARIVSHDYDLGEWQPDFQIEVDAPDKPVGLKKTSKILYWVVPASAAGRWRWELGLDGGPAPFELSLDQQFQKLNGRLTVSGQGMAIENGVLAGERIGFAAASGSGAAAVRYEFSGRIAGDAIKGTVRVVRGAQSQEIGWSAARVEAWPPRHTDAPAPQVAK